MLKPFRFHPLLKAFPNPFHHDHVTKKSSTIHTRHVQPTAEGVEVDEVTDEKKTVARVHTTAKGDIEGVALTREKKTVAHVEATAEGAKGVAVTEETTTLSHVHETVEGVAEVELTPPHPPREETPEYTKAHHELTIVKDSPCAICGVRNSTLNDRKENPFGAQALETHHYPIERSLLDACDPKRVAVMFPQVKDKASLEAFVDSEDNLMVLCDVHHRHPHYGIHHLVPQDFFIQPFLIPGYQVVATKEEAAQLLATDQNLLKKGQ